MKMRRCVKLYSVVCRSEDGKWVMHAMYKDRDLAYEKASILSNLFGRPCRVIEEIVR